MTKLSQVRVEGPLAPHARGFNDALKELGYTPLSAANQVRLMAHLSRWLDSCGSGPEKLTSDSVAAFLEARQSDGYTCWLSERGLRPLLRYLRDLGAAPEPTPTVDITPLGKLLEEYRRYLLHERGLASTTVVSRETVARQFLQSVLSATGDLRLAELTTADVSEFVLREGPRRSVGTAKLLVTALRSLLGYLHVAGHTPWSLVPAVPAVAGWRGSALPRALDAEVVARLLGSCDRRRHRGRRDYAVMLLMVRLGLRAGEVAALGLHDIDWRSGELMVRGKGGRHERLPLPVDVGEAIAGYLRRGRADSDGRAVFVGVKAPHGRLTAAAVTAVVRNASRRAGVGVVSAHRLRHTAATEMLTQGAPLAEIAQVLRHRSLLTTAIYAKVDRAGLRSLARPWPGGEQ